MSACIIYDCDSNSLKELSMELISVFELQILTIIMCMVGCAYGSFKAGHKAGIEHAIDYLEAQGVIEFTED